MKLMSKFVSFILVATLVVVSSIPMVHAGLTHFDNKLVDSNSWTSIAETKKLTSSSTSGTILVGNIYKADGSSSNYNNIFAKATSVGQYRGVSKGQDYSLTIPASSRAAGTRIELWAMGNWPWLDCRVSGSWSVY